MSFWKAFFRVLAWRPGPALGALYWYLTRRRVRARNQIRRASAQLPYAYQLWIQTWEDQADLADRAAALAKMAPSAPAFEVFVHTTGNPRDIERTIASVTSQLYGNWRLTIALADDSQSVPRAWLHSQVRVLPQRTEDSFKALNMVIEATEADFIVSVAAGDVLARPALFWLAEAAIGNPGTAILYGDEDTFSSNGGRSRPWFKPAWNEELFLAVDYLSGACAVDTRSAREVTQRASPEGYQDLLFAILAAKPGFIVHVPHVVTHRQARSPETRVRGRIESVRKYLRPFRANAYPGPFGTVKVEWPLPDQPALVSIIIPTRDKLTLLQPCVTSVLQKTDYPRFEVLIVDNGSIEADTHEYLRHISAYPDVEVLVYNKPYNYSAINNFAALQARGTFLCLLNNDTEVLAEAWLTELMRYAVRPSIGAAGAKLLYDDGTIQHAGVIVGMGEAAGHAHRFCPADEPGYFGLPHAAHFVTAVTGACLVVAKEKYQAVNGLDEKHLAVAYNDVDLCLKLQSVGFRNVYVPHAVLLHHESKSRGNDKSKENSKRYNRELAVLQERWQTRTYNDPLLNPNLDRNSETFIPRL